MKELPFKAGKSLADLKNIGVSSYGFVKTTDIVFSNEVRRLCEGNVCRRYGTSWACPPAVGTVSECQARCLAYSDAMVFASVYQLEDSFDIDGMSHGWLEFKHVCDRLYDLLEPPFLLLSNEGCARCQTCTHPSAPCRFPDRLFPALEGFGILVNKLADSASIPYIAGENTVSYFGMLCH